jgi:hypothetical protein
MSDKTGWEVEGFIDRLTKRTDSNSERLVLEAVSHLQAFSQQDTHLRTAIEKQQAEIERLEVALREIERWSRAYPLNVFPEPDMAKAHELLKAGGMTLDAVSASNMRHVVEGVGKIARVALEGK